MAAVLGHKELVNMPKKRERMGDGKVLSTHLISSGVSVQFTSMLKSASGHAGHLTITLPGCRCERTWPTAWSWPLRFCITIDFHTRMTRRNCDCKSYSSTSG